MRLYVDNYYVLTTTWKCIVYTSMHCVYLYALYLRLCIVYTSMHCIYVYALCIYTCIVFTSMHCIYVYALCIYPCIVLTSMHCIYVYACYICACIATCIMNNPNTSISYRCIDQSVEFAFYLQNKKIIHMIIQ